MTFIIAYALKIIGKCRKKIFFELDTSRFWARHIKISQNKNCFMSNFEPSIRPTLYQKSSNYWDIWGKLRKKKQFLYCVCWVKAPGKPLGLR